MSYRFFLGCFLIFINSTLWAQASFSFEQLFEKNAGSFDSIIDRKKEYRVQIAYTQIDQTSNGEPIKKTYTFDTDKYYYYAASVVKFPAAVFCLEKFNRLSKYGISLFDSFDINNTACASLTNENLWKNKSPQNFSFLLKNLLVISDNNAFNPIYDFVTPIEFAQRFEELNFKHAVICRRFAKCDMTANSKVNAISFFDAFCNVKMEQLAMNFDFVNSYSGRLSPHVGRAYLAEKLEKRPFDFSDYNYVSLSDLHRLMQWVIFEDSAQLKLRSSDFSFLKNTLSEYPRSLGLKDFDETKMPDSYMKYFWRADSNQTVIPPRFHLYNKVGQAYGFLTDCMYFKDDENGVEFFLTASIYVNKNETLNDGKYEYSSIGFPFLENIFAAIYNWEVERRMEH